MYYDLPFFCPFIYPRLCFFSYFTPCVVSSIIYNKIFNKGRFSWIGFILCPFSAYGLRRFVINSLDIDEAYEESVVRSCCFCNSFVQDINEMKVNKIGLYKYEDEPDYDI
ncbi:hypothetical protein SLOPH_1733 [Spraguea lophii 42_110]|uniref:Uncharacterized protein n=1 Tax=Spraguea lophii (strain 42_110) TaxID=1358809 RepID=S7W890_SPRLO|nr:hypothetical protein SLOPH_1733 [Spraguea lophii 42_110]